MKNHIHLTPKHSLILIMDQSAGKIPESMNRALVPATSSCVAVGTLSEYDGDTLVILSDKTPLVSSGLSLVFDGVLHTPTKKLSLCSVLDEAFITLDVQAEKTHIQVWANDDSEPNEIYLAVLEQI
jgi:hypothetical protein